MAGYEVDFRSVSCGSWRCGEHIRNDGRKSFDGRAEVEQADPARYRPTERPQPEHASSYWAV